MSTFNTLGDYPVYRLTRNQRGADKHYHNGGKIGLIFWSPGTFDRLAMGPIHRRDLLRWLKLAKAEPAHWPGFRRFLRWTLGFERDRKPGETPRGESTSCAWLALMPGSPTTSPISVGKVLTYSPPPLFPLGLSSGGNRGL